MTNELEMSEVTKRYGDKPVLDNLNLSVAAGSIFALLGANGAGKTTTVQILSTLIPFDSGTISLGGYDLRRDPGSIRRLISVTGQYAAVDGLSTGLENLVLVGELHHLGRRAAKVRAHELLERFDLTAAAGRRASQYSGGMRRRLDLAMSLVARPRILFLDEPTTGLDPRSRREVWSLVSGLATEGTTIVLTTQYLDEAEELADRIAVLESGSVAAEGTPDELKAMVPGGHIEISFDSADALTTAAAQFTESVTDPATLTLRLPSDGTISSVEGILDRLEADAHAGARIDVHRPDLDDVFFALTAEHSTAGVR